jgi:hypothetical protein
VEDRQILSAIQIARRNWSDWRDVFEHGTPVRANPLLANQIRFAFFCKDYSVGRTIRKGSQNDFRVELCSPPFSEAIRDDSGRALDRLETSLRTRFGTHDGRNRIISVLSKVAAFLRPERFAAWDRYAKRGVNIARGRSPSCQFNTYADYLAEFDNVWNGATGQEIRGYAISKGAQGVEAEPRFLRRVLDVHLMRCGGRTTWGPTGAPVPKAT